MNISKIAMSYIILGLSLFIVSSSISLATALLGKPMEGNIIILIGLCAMNLFWIMALQVDVYKKEEKV